MSRAPSGASRIEEWMGPAGAAYGVLKPLVGFLADPLDQTTGDPEGLRSSAQAWRAAAQDVRDLSGKEISARHGVLAAWEGGAAEAFDAGMSEVYESMVQVAQDFEDTAEMLELAADGAQEAQEMVEDIVRELIAWAIITIIIALGSAWFTLGASMAAGAGVVAAEAAIAAGRCVTVATRLAAILRRLRDFLKRMSEFAKLYKLTKIRSVGAKEWATARFASKGGYELLATNWVLKIAVVQPVAGPTVEKVTGADGKFDKVPPLF